MGVVVMCKSAILGMRVSNASTIDTDLWSWPLIDKIRRDVADANAALYVVCMLLRQFPVGQSAVSFGGQDIPAASGMASRRDRRRSPPPQRPRTDTPPGSRLLARMAQKHEKIRKGWIMIAGLWKQRKERKASPGGLAWQNTQVHQHGHETRQRRCLLGIPKTEISPEFALLGSRHGF